MKRIISTLLALVILCASVISVGALMPVFLDINEKHWFYEDVMWLAEYVSGDKMGYNDPTYFKPNGKLTRAEMVSMLHAVEGAPEADIPDGVSWKAEVEGKWCEKAVAWAYAAGIVNGYPDGTFRPNETITREQFAKVLKYYAEYRGIFKKPTLDVIDTFKDGAKVGKWARDSVAFAVEHGIIKGRTVDTIVPQGTATRAECCTMIRRFIEAFDLNK